MSLIPTAWRGRRQTPAAPIPPADQLDDITEAEAIRAGLEAICHSRTAPAIAHIDDLIRIWSQHRRDMIDVPQMLDQLIDVRSLIVKARVKA